MGTTRVTILKVPVAVSILVLCLIQTSCTQSLSFVGKFHYQDFVSFLRSDQNCGFLPSNLPHIIKKHHSFEKESCLIFITNVIDISSRSMFTEIETKYFAFGAKYSFDNKNRTCYKTPLQKIKSLLICEGPTDVNGTTCDQGCNLGKEVCRSAMGDDKEFCISERNYQESCDDSLPCSRNLECKASGNKKTCQCKQDYEAIEGRCLKGQLPLGELCVYDSQCLGNLTITRCLYDAMKDKRVCSCVKGYIAFRNKCHKGGVELHKHCLDDIQCTGTENAKSCTTVELHIQATCRCNNDYIEIDSKCYKTELLLDKPCYIDEQCLGAKNATVCRAKHNGTKHLTCQCNIGFLRYGETCLQENKQLFEVCEIDDQCNRTSLVCRVISGRKMCLCKEGFEADIEHMECFKGTALRPCTSGQGNQYFLPAVFGVLGFVVIMVCLVVILLYAMKRREQATKRIDKNQDTSATSAMEIHNSLAENSSENVNQKPEGSVHLPDFDLQQTKKKQRNNFIKPTEDVYNEVDQIEETDSQNVDDFPKHKCSNKKQTYDRCDVMYSHLHGNPLHMCKNEYDF